MRLTGRNKLDAFKSGNAQARGPMDAWIGRTERAQWNTMADLKAEFASASILADNAVIFDIGGNNYRLHARVVPALKTVHVKEVWTHADYDKWNNRRKR